MAQVTLYLPDKIAQRIRKAAATSGQSVSAFLTGLATRELEPGGWTPSFRRLYGTWEGDFNPEPDTLPDHVELP